MPDLREEAWKHLDGARMSFEGHDIGAYASTDDTRPTLNYDHCFVRDFAICAPAFLLRGDAEIVRRFLATTLHLQGKEPALRAYKPRRGLMPASFRPETSHGWPMLDGDYGEESIARVTPVDSVFWWLLTLRAYTRSTGDRDLARTAEFQEGIRLILHLTLEGSFEVFPTIIVPEGSFMIDRRMGVYGHPLEVEALFFAALRAASELLDDDGEWHDALEERLGNLRHHVGQYYWMDRDGLRQLRHRGQDQYGEQVMNIFNVFPESIPDWVGEWIPEEGGYFAGNVGPGRIDFRFFAQGNLLAISSGLATGAQSRALIRTYEEHWDELVGPAPLRIAYPALEGEAWRVVTGADEKNRPWRYQNGGCWPCLLWSFATAMVHAGRLDLLERAVDAAEERLAEDDWPEYYDGRAEPGVGKRARRWQSWTMGGYVFAKACLEDPSVADLYSWEANIRAEPADTRRLQASTAEGAPKEASASGG